MKQKLKIDNLEDLKITSIKRAIHFKYKEDYYFVLINSTGTITTTLYKGRCRGNVEPISGCFGTNYNLIKYINNRKNLSYIDKEYFVRKLYELELIDTNEEIKEKSKKIQQEYEEKYNLINKLRREIDTLVQI